MSTLEEELKHIDTINSVSNEVHVSKATAEKILSSQALHKVIEQKFKLEVSKKQMQQAGKVNKILYDLASGSRRELALEDFIDKDIGNNRIFKRRPSKKALAALKKGRKKLAEKRKNAATTNK